MKHRGQRILLVGGAGFIGHHLVTQLASDGAQVHVVDHLAPYDARKNRLSPYGASIFEERQQLFQKHGVILHRLDASENRSLCNLFQQIDPEVVLHLAAVASSEQTDLQPALALRSSLQTLSNSLECSKGRVQRFIYFSSSMVYGNFLSGEADENHPTAPVDLYGAIKLAGEHLVVAYGKNSHLPWTILRPSAVYGPRCLKGSVIEKLLMQAISGNPLTIMGDPTSRQRLYLYR